MKTLVNVLFNVGLFLFNVGLLFLLDWFGASIFTSLLIVVGDTMIFIALRLFITSLVSIILKNVSVSEKVE